MRKVIKGQLYFSNKDASEVETLASCYGARSAFGDRDTHAFISDYHCEKLSRLGILVRAYSKFMKTAPFKSGDLVRNRHTKQVGTVMRCFYTTSSNEAMVAGSPQWSYAIVSVTDLNTGRSQNYQMQLSDIKKIKTK